MLLGAICGLVLLAPLHADGTHITHVDDTRIDYAERPVREFLKLHFAGSRAFSATGLDKKARLLTRRFRSGLYKFFGSAAQSSGAVPLVTDPFTGSQGATTFVLGKPKVRGERAWVPVNFSDGTNTWTITYLLRSDQERNDDRWRIDDIQDVRGMLLSEVLKR
jgi:hypothetical protein